MVGQLALWKYGRGYALYEKSELIAVFMYRKGALRVAELFAQIWPLRFGEVESIRPQGSANYILTLGSSGRHWREFRPPLVKSVQPTKPT